jgi:hypothetical protein
MKLFKFGLHLLLLLQLESCTGRLLLFRKELELKIDFLLFLSSSLVAQFPFLCHVALPQNPLVELLVVVFRYHPVTLGRVESQQLIPSIPCFSSLVLW